MYGTIRDDDNLINESGEPNKEPVSCRVRIISGILSVFLVVPCFILAILLGLIYGLCILVTIPFLFLYFVINKRDMFEMEKSYKFHEVSDFLQILAFGPIIAFLASITGHW
eukprot:TRINITY_DN12500_c0_g1_i1.p1 TRINITY_DN12500_c0_g1~~TRINITY_DN12500_c0_g1_i1.p1  ORF type:complete len:111 (+),score=19.64 TRINITY_DN12500_c0_g1_i1:76-408(+)